MAIGVFFPSSSLIADITLGVQTVTTFTAPHDFTVGEIISFRVSRQYGTVDLNNQQALVQSISTFTITVNIDSRNYTPFVASPPFPETLAMVVPSGSGIVPGSFPAQTSLLDTFDHIPPR